MQIKYGKHQFKGNRIKKQFRGFEVHRNGQCLWFIVLKNGKTTWMLHPENYFTCCSMKKANSFKAIKRQLRKGLKLGIFQTGDVVECIHIFVGYEINIVL